MITIQTGERYTVDGYGEVQVTSLAEKVTAVCEDGSDNRHITIKFVVDPDTPFTTNRDMKTKRADEFIELVRTSD